MNNLFVFLCFYFAVTSSSEYNETVATTSMSRGSNWKEEVPKLKVFTLSEIKLATKNFRHEPIIGDGIFENVFKGWLNEKTLAPSKPGAGIMVTVKLLNSEIEEGQVFYILTMQSTN